MLKMGFYELSFLKECKTQHIKLNMLAILQDSEYNILKS